MSRTEPTDLICRARRRELNPEERRQLQDLVQRSGEARLLSVMLSEFERESQVHPGDDELLARISERALAATTKAPPRSRRRASLTLLLAAALMLLGSAAWAWRAVFVPSRADAPKATPSAAPRPSAHKPRRGSAPPVLAPKGALPLEAPESLAPREEPITKPRESALRPAPQGKPPSPVTNAAPQPPLSPAREFFARANSLRRAGRTSEAAALYQLIVDAHPDSREAPPARLALAKMLRGKAPARALAHFRVLAEQGDALRPEALWGIAESARSLGLDAVEAQALSDLLREFPDSPYADAARRQTSR